MFDNGFGFAGLIFGLGYVVLFGSIAFAIPVLVRLMFAATRTLNAVTEATKLRTALLLADDDGTATEGQPNF